MAPPRPSHALVRGKKPSRWSESDSGEESEEEQLKLPAGIKAEILAEYTNRPVEGRNGEAKVKEIVTELDSTVAAVQLALDSLCDAARDVGEVNTFDGVLDEDHMPPDAVRRASPSAPTPPGHLRRF